MRKMLSIILTIIITNQFLFLAYAATQKGNPDRYDIDNRGYEVGEEQSDGSVPDSNEDQ